MKARRVTAGIRARLEELEGSELDPRSSELQVVLCWLVQGDIPIDEDELNAARRRAMFVLAAGGDPHRDVGLDSIAAERLADELDTPGRRAQLAAALDELPTARSPGGDCGSGVALRRSRARLALVRALAAGRRARGRVAVSAARRLLWTAVRGDLETGTSPSVEAPRNLPGGQRPQPYSRVDAPYFRSPGFYVRIGGLAVVVAAGLSLLLLRAWSIQVLHGKQYRSAAQTQAFRTVDLLGSRGAIVDAADN